MKIGKKLIALFLGIAMIMSLLPMTAFAEGEGESDALPVCDCETACTADSMNAACPVCGAEGALPEQCGYSAAPETAENEQVLYVQSLIDALPDADMITEDNADAVMDQLDGIDTARMDLTDAELEMLDFSRYIAVVSALNALTSDEIVPMAAEDTGSTITYKPEITWQRTKELVYSGIGLEGLFADAKTGYLDFTGKYTDYVGTVNWDFADISAKLDHSDDVIGSDNVWDYGKNTQYTNTDPSNTDGTSIVPQQGISAATWNNRSYKAQTVTDNGNTYTYAEGQFDDGHVKSYTVRKFSGTFTWPEGYDLTSGINILSKNDANYQEIYDAVEDDPDLTAAFGGNKVIAVNDDMYVFVYKEGTTLNSENYTDYLAFWTGTAGKGVWSWDTNSPQGSSENNFWGAEWMPTTPVTYNNQSALRAFHIVKPNLDVEKAGSNGRDTLSAPTQAKMNQSDGWYAFADGDAIATVLNNQYKDTVNAGETFHIDIYCFDTDKVGGMDELELVLTKAAPTQANVTVRYWLNAVGDDPNNDSNFLGSTTMTNQEIGSAITLSGGTAVNQLNYKKADAIVKNSNNDVEDGIQMNKPFTVTADSEANIIDVIYVPAGQKIVHLYAGESTVTYDGNEHTVKDVTIKESGYDVILVLDSVATASRELNDGTTNKVVNITAQRTETLPGIYDVTFTAKSFVESSSGQSLGNYTVFQHPGKLTITYAPSSAVRTYDFGVTNSYDVLEGVEKQAISITASVNYVTVENGVVLYTPQNVNTGETITLTLTYSGGYTCEKQISFYPATNVLYEESFMDNNGTNGNWMLEVGNSGTVVNDNETTVYGYAEMYESFNSLSNGGALKATLNLNGGRRVSTSDAVTFTFTGTGFDLISECGTDTGMLVAGVQRNNEDGTTTAVKAFVVDTYFCGDAASNNPIITGPGILDYQVPVIRDMDLPYGTYTVTVYGYLTDASGASVSTQSYGLYDTQALPVANSAIDADTILSDLGMSEYLGTDISVSFMDDNSVLNGGTGATADKSETSGAWGWLKGLFSNRATVQSASDNGDINVYLDAFRVYQPLENETNYAADEQDLKYGSVYDYVLASGQKDLEEEGFIESAMVYVEYDGEQDAAIIRDYKQQGPQNEVYLSVGNYVGFVLEDYTEGQTVMISAKAVGNGAVLGYIEAEFSPVPVKAGELSATEMYYDVTDCVINNDGEYILVLGNISTVDGALLSISGIKLPTDVIPAADSVVAKIITKAYDKDETAAYNPETFTVSYKDTAKIGKYTTISIKTSTTDVVKVDVFSGETSLSNNRGYSPNNMKAVERGKAKLYSFNVSAMIDSKTNIFYVVAYDINGNASNPVAVTINGK